MSWRLGFEQSSSSSTLRAGTERSAGDRHGNKECRIRLSSLICLGGQGKLLGWRIKVSTAIAGSQGRDYGTGAPHTVKIVADHAYPIPDGSYTLICCDADGELPADIWVVGRLREDGTFEKVSVFSSAEDEEVKVRKLGLEQVNTILC